MNRYVHDAELDAWLRGADAVYVATAAQFGAELITLDEEQSQRGAKVVAACNPGIFEYSP